MSPSRTALTFGVEFEFCVASLPKDLPDPHPTAAPYFRSLNDPLSVPGKPKFYPGFHASEFTQLKARPTEIEEWCVQLRVAEVLTEAGFPAITKNEIEISKKCTEKERLSYWIVCDDPSIHLPGFDNGEPGCKYAYTWHGIEVNAPAMYYDQVAVNQVKSVCALLAKTFRIHINDSTGLHVHVGDGKKGFDAEKLNSLMAMLFVFEPQLDTLHPLTRRYQNYWCTSLNTTSKLARDGGTHAGVSRTPNTRAELLEKLLGIEDKTRIIEEMGRARDDFSTYKLAYNLYNMARPTGKQTIEFRQHESTLDPDRVAMWIRTCVGMVEIPFRESRESIVALLRAHVNHSVGEFDVIKVLLLLNLTAEADFYDARFHALYYNKNEKVLVEDIERKPPSEESEVSWKYRSEAGWITDSDHEEDSDSEKRETRSETPRSSRAG